MTSYYLVGRVPVQMEEHEGGGVSLIAFNPLMGGFVADPVYYSAIKLGDLGRVRQIDEVRYRHEVDRLRETSEAAV